MLHAHPWSLRLLAPVLPLFAVLACDAGATDSDPTADDTGAGDSGSDTEGEDTSITDTADTDTGDEVFGQAALDFVTERLVGTYQGEWQLYGLDGSDAQALSYAWTDVITGSNPRIEADRAIVDIVDEMDGGRWQQTVEFIEGVYLAEDGGVGDYFTDVEGVITIMVEVEPDHWESTSDLAEYDTSAMENVTEENFVAGWKTATKLVTWVDGWERHDVTVLTHVEYSDDSGATVTVEFTSLEGYHQKYE